MMAKEGKVPSVQPYGHAPESVQDRRPVSRIAAWSAWVGAAICLSAWLSYETVVGPDPHGLNKLWATPYELLAMLVSWLTVPFAVTGFVRRRDIDRPVVLMAYGLGVVLAVCLPIVLDERYRRFLSDWKYWTPF
jgi:hypothetical protein